MTDDESDPVTVVYVGAVSRSGSTLLDRLLGQIPGHFSGGELKYLWKRGWERNELCGCGEPFRECERWQAILDDFRDRVGENDLSEMGRTVDSVTAHWQTPLYFFESMWSSSFRHRVQRARQYVGALYRSILTVTGNRVIVDSSKFPVYGYFLAGIEDLDLRCIHLLRDPRAVAHSWQRKKERPEIHWKTDYMSQYNPLTIAVVWVVLNLCLKRFKRYKGSYARIPYESLAESPAATIRSLYEQLDMDTPALNFLDGNQVRLETNHTASGNPMRMKTGELDVELDDAWRSEMSRWSRYTVTGLTWPFLRNYGY